MTGIVSWLALLYVALIPVGRSGLPMNAQWGDVLFPFVALAAMRAGPAVRWWSRGDWPLAAYLGVTCLTALASPDPLTGLKELLKQSYVASVFLVFRHLARDASLTRRLQAGFVISVALVTVASIGVVFVRIPGVPLSTLGLAHPLPLFGMVRRLRGAFEAPELLGNALLVAFVLALTLRATESRGLRPWWTGIAILIAAGEFLTFSHSVAGFCVAAVFFAGARIPSRFVRVLGWGVALAVFLIVNVASVVDPIPRDAPTDGDVGSASINLLGTRAEVRLMHYAALKRVAWSAFLDHPVAGVGPGRFSLESERAYQEGRLAIRHRGLVPHSSPAGRLAESGVAGGVSWLLLWAAWMRGLGSTPSAASPSRRAAFAAVLGLLVNSVNADVMNFRFLWLALAWTSWPGARPELATTPERTPAASVPTGS